jgi:hypothetical protein
MVDGVIVGKHRARLNPAPLDIDLAGFIKKLWRSQVWRIQNSELNWIFWIGWLENSGAGASNTEILEQKEPRI